MKFIILLFTLILIVTAAQRIYNKDYLYYGCNSYCDKVLDQEDACGYYDDDVSYQDYYGCLCGNETFFSNLKSCDCFTSIIASVSKSVCSKATEDSDWGYYDDSTLSIMDFFTADNTPASNTGMTTQTDGAINDNQNTGSKTSSGAANYLTSFSIGTFFVFVLGLI